MQKKRLVVYLSAALGATVTADVSALSDKTNIGDSWKGWGLSQSRAVEGSVQFELSESESVEASVSAGTFAWMYPSITLKMVVDDNYYNTDDENQVRKESNIDVNGGPSIEINPRAALEYEGEASYARFSGELVGDVSLGDFNDTLWNTVVVAELGWLPTEKLSLWGGIGWEYGFEEYGQGLASGPNVVLFPDHIEYDIWSARIGGTYGVDEHGAPKLNFEASREEKYYQNYRQYTADRDSVIDTIGGGIDFWVQPNTAAVFDVRYSDSEYGDSLFDNTQWRYLLGAKWYATYQTQGYVRLGWTEKEMNGSAQVEDASEASWEVGADWKPSPFANVAVSASRDLVDEYFSGYMDVKEYRATWRHQWESHLASRLTYNIGERDYPVYVGTDRFDDYWDIELAIDYEFRPWLNFGVSARHTDQDSNTAGYSYKENVYTLQVDMSFD